MRNLILVLTLCCFAVQTVASEPPATVKRVWTIDGVERTALVYAPRNASKAACPLLFAFHGHGGTAISAARKFGYQSLWPEAICVYMQGLPTPGALTDPLGTKAGWQSARSSAHLRSDM